MNKALSNYVVPPCKQPAVWPYYARPHRKGQRIDNEQQRELLSKLLPGKWVVVSKYKDQLIMCCLEPNGWRFDCNLNAGCLEYRLVWRQRLDAFRVLRRSAEEDV